MDNSVKLFVGCCSNGEDAESMAVLEYSVRKNSSLPVDITWMMQTHDDTSPYYGWSTETWATPFSGFRWSLPEVCNFEGRAIYCDSDFIWLSDIAKLWNQEFEPGKIVMAKGGDNSWRYCSSLWDCEAAKNVMPSLSDIKKTPTAHQQLMGLFSTNQQFVQAFEGNWNCIDGENLPLDMIDALHYSDMSTQFHLPRAVARMENTEYKHWFDGEMKPHWRKDLQLEFDRMLFDAESMGYTVDKYIPTDNEFFGEYVKESQANYRNAHKWSK